MRYIVQIRVETDAGEVWRGMGYTDNSEAARAMARQCERLGDTARVHDTDLDDGGEASIVWEGE